MGENIPTVSDQPQFPELPRLLKSLEDKAAELGVTTLDPMEAFNLSEPTEKQQVAANLIDARAELEKGNWDACGESIDAAVEYASYIDDDLATELIVLGEEIFDFAPGAEGQIE